MPSYPKNYPFYNWVPKPVGIIILFVFFLPILTVGGTYSVASTEMMSGLGIISEHIQFANFATSIGMAAFCPFLYRLVVIRRQKMMCLAGFSLMYIFSYICAKTDSVFLLALCSIFMGFLRMVLMMVNLFTLIKYAGHIEAYDKITPGNEPTTDEGWDKLDIERSAAQPAIYPSELYNRSIRLLKTVSLSIRRCILYGKETYARQLYRIDRLRACCRRKRGWTGKYLAFPLSCRKRRRRNLYFSLYRTGSDLWIYPADN